MPLQKLPGQVGYVVKPIASANLRKDELGKFTDYNHLDRILNLEDSIEYDRKIVPLFSQINVAKNDFFENIINGASTWMVDNPAVPFYWDIDLPVELPKIMEIPASTSGEAKPGVDNHTIQFVSSRKIFVKNDHVALGSYERGPVVEITADPLPYNGYYLYSAVLATTDKTEYLTDKWFKIGVPLLKIDNSIGEFDQDLSSIAHTGGKMRLYDRLGAGFGVEHTATSWAQQVVPTGKDGKPLDIQQILKYRIDAKGQPQVVGATWMRTVEMMLNKEMQAMKIRRFLYGSAATTQTSNQQQEVKYKSDGLMRKIRKAGNYYPISRGDFSINLLRDVFDDFYRRRVDEEDRNTVLYANRSGMKLFREAAKEDLRAAGFTMVLDSGNRFATGQGQNITLNWGVSNIVTEETGLITIKELPDLDYRGTEYEFGRYKDRAPVFMSLDVLDNSENSIKNNIRIVRPKGQPGPTWGYIDGRRHHSGFSASQGMQSASKFPGSTIWMEDRCDLRVDDLSRTFLMEEEEDYLY